MIDISDFSCAPLDLPQVDLFLFISLERSEKVISSDEVARASASDRLGKIIGKDF